MAEEIIKEDNPEEEDTQKGKYMTFKSGHEYFGIEIRYINEIIGMQSITAIPEVEPYIKGLINLRGKIIPVIDVRIRFNQEPFQYTDRTCIIIINVKRMDENFRQPFFSKSIGEFWRRWHITLGTWMKDYIFYPFSLSKQMNRFGKWSKKHLGNTVGKAMPICLADLLIFFVVGIWHGAAWKYIAYGMYNGIIIAVSSLLEPFTNKILSKKGR